MAAAAAGPPAAGFVDVCSAEALRAQGGRMVTKVPPTNRYVALIADRGRLHCIDATCYHMGGPLALADVEEVGGFGPCVTCPWHRYQISLTTGCKLLLGLDGQHKPSPQQKQRVHRAEEREGRVLVQLSAEGEVESDNYAFKAPAPAQRAPAVQRSGEIFSGASPVGAMVARSMHGADGLAPWALPGGRGPVIGAPRPGPPLQRPQPQAAAGVLIAGSWGPFRVSGTRAAGRNTVELTLACAAGCRIALAGLGRHVDARLPDGGESRPYTPYFLPDAPSEMRLLVKRYEGGAVSPRLAALQPGGSVLLQGPLPGGMPKGFLDGAETAALLAAGTGLTPFLQILHDMRAARGGPSLRRIQLVCFHREEEDILLRGELDALAQGRSGLPGFSVTYVLSDPPPGWPPERAGRISAEMLRALAPAAGPAARLLWCGPPAFNDACAQLAAEAGYGEGQCKEFA
eukprot:TRINITY_DN36321_c0_g1_i1.p1 TRINITY_DN36321_c0_g1~~TRINITY_DN36321_c0_g1_i1.p1  ORF type:complete len:488 (+),score=165.35 TRINITY_DN36321_c0_g1_i1:91-1464(+)